jgi:hypothetical protein
MESIETCLTDCFAFADAHEIPLCTVAIGSGRGGLDWDTEVEPIFIRLNSEYSDMSVTLYHIEE